MGGGWEQDWSGMRVGWEGDESEMGAGWEGDGSWMAVGWDWPVAIPVWGEAECFVRPKFQRTPLGNADRMRSCGHGAGQCGSDAVRSARMEREPQQRH
eukprot:8362726-Pyramimonas_sp.AAC.1